MCENRLKIPVEPDNCGSQSYLRIEVITFRYPQILHDILIGYPEHTWAIFTYFKN